MFVEKRRKKKATKIGEVRPDSVIIMVTTTTTVETMLDHLKQIALNTEHSSQGELFRETENTYTIYFISMTAIKHEELS